MCTLVMMAGWSVGNPDGVVAMMGDTEVRQAGMIDCVGLWADVEEKNAD